MNKQLFTPFVIITFVVLLIPNYNRPDRQSTSHSDSYRAIKHESTGHITFNSNVKEKGKLDNALLNNGCQWYSGGPAQNPSLTSIVIDSGNSKTLYTSDGIYLFKTVDGGDSWTLLQNVGAGEVLVADPVHAGVIYAGYDGVYSGVYRISQGGLSSTFQYVGDGTIAGIAIAPSLPETLFAVGFSHIYKTTNSGDVWNTVWTGQQSDTGYMDASLGIAINPSNPDVVLTTTTSSYDYTVMETTDGGVTWRPTNLKGSQAREIVFDPKTPNVVYAATLGGGIQKSLDTGNTWITTTLGLPSQFATAIIIDPNNNLRLYAAIGYPYQDLYISDDGGSTWQPFGDPKTFIDAFGLAMNDLGILYVATWQGVWSCDTTHYFISGQVVDGNNNPIAGVTVPATIGNPPQLVTSTTTGVDGKYTLSNLGSVNYTITPYKSGYLFTPPEVNINPSLQSTQDFIGTQEGKKPWLIMYYLAGDNNREDAVNNMLDRLMIYGNQPSYNIAVMYDGGHTNDSKYYYIADNTIITVKNELDSGNPATLIDFVNWARSMFPADHTALILFDHGSLTQAMKDIGDNPDPNTNIFTVMSIKGLGDAINTLVTQGGKFDILFLETCFMGTMEDAYQFQNDSDYYIASENYVILGGIVNYLNDFSVTTTPKELAIKIATDYHDVVSSYSLPHTISVSNMNILPLLDDKVGVLAGSIKDQMSLNLANTLQTQVLNQVQRFDSNEDCSIDPNDEAIDLYDFARLVKEKIAVTSIQNAAQDVMNIIQDSLDPSNRYIIYNKSISGSMPTIPNLGCPGKNWNLNNGHGVSIFFNNPNTKRSFYNGNILNFAIGTDWQLSTVSTKSYSLTITPIEWGPMLVTYTNVINPNAADNPSLPPLVAPLVLPTQIYLPFIMNK